MRGRLLLIVTPDFCRLRVSDTVALAVAGGVDAVQLRDKQAGDAGFLRLARRLAELCHGLDVPLILNDRVHLVGPAGADGVHVGEDDMPPEEARRLLGPGALIGISTHDRAEVAAARRRGADYIGLGPMFPTGTKDLTRAPKGPELVREVAGATDLPLFPIGGIDATNLPALVEAGATRAAVCAAICAAPDPRRAATTLRNLLPPRETKEPE